MSIFLGVHCAVKQLKD